jgi:hypothetical protein
MDLHEIARNADIQGVPMTEDAQSLQYRGAFRAGSYVDDTGKATLLAYDTEGKIHKFKGKIAKQGALGVTITEEDGNRITFKKAKHEWEGVYTGALKTPKDKNN